MSLIKLKLLKTEAKKLTGKMSIKQNENFTEF